MKRAAIISRLVVIVGNLALAGMAAYRGVTSGRWDMAWLVFNGTVAAAFTYELATRWRRLAR